MGELPGYALALEYGSQAHGEARFWLHRLRPFEVQPYELPRYALDAVNFDDADAALVDTTTYLLYQREHENWESKSYRVTDAWYAIAVRHDREATFEWVDRSLGLLQYDGRLEAIIKRWL